MNGYRPQFAGFGARGMIPPVVKALLISNAAVFLITYFMPGTIAGIFGLVPKFVWSRLWIWQLFTYMFLHGGFWHILMNMFILWMFGSDLERTWGSREFLKFYIVCGVGAGLFNVLFQPSSLIPIIGASGAIYGVLVAYALMYPNRLVYIYFLFPVKVKYLVIFLAAMSFFMSMGGSHDNIAHFAHLGGMLIGYVYLKFNIGMWRINSLKYKISSFKHKQKMQKIAREHEKEQKLMEEVDQILDKINKVGYDKLTKNEKKILEDASERLSNK